ncbi:MAG TPA: hypothetical protein VK557_12510, partial [Pyrinomonadaceae bacterium]|nr:hypothetical protein [Pyrinomonadaceae bacterium]
FVCDRCGNVEDVEWYDVPRPASRSLGKRIVRECQLIFRGFCAKCAQRNLQPPQVEAPSGSIAVWKDGGWRVAHSSALLA